MKIILKGHTIKFAAGKMISKTMLDDVKDPEGWIRSVRASIYDHLGKKIAECKPDTTTESTNEAGDKIFTAELYVFTLAELKEFVSDIRNEVGSSSINGEEI